MLVHDSVHWRSDIRKRPYGVTSGLDEVQHYKSECASTVSTSPSQLCLQFLFTLQKRLMCFPQAAMCRDISQTFYSEFAWADGRYWSPLWTICCNICFTGFLITPIHCVLFRCCHLNNPLFSEHEKLLVTSVLHNLEPNHSCYCPGSDFRHTTISIREFNFPHRKKFNCALQSESQKITAN